MSVKNVIFIKSRFNDQPIHEEGKLFQKISETKMKAVYLRRQTM